MWILGPTPFKNLVMFPPNVAFLVLIDTGVVHSCVDLINEILLKELLPCIAVKTQPMLSQWTLMNIGNNQDRGSLSKNI